MFNVFLLFCIPLAIMYYIVFVWQWKKNSQNFYLESRPFVFGHRGSPTHITENTLPSFEKAMDQGADGIELDIRLSKDKQMVIFHDSDLNRLANVNKKIQELTYKQLQKIKLEQNQTIPLLKDIVVLLDKIKVLNIEIKSEGPFKGHQIIKPLIQFLDEHSIDQKCIVSSFNPLILLRIFVTYVLLLLDTVNH